MHEMRNIKLKIYLLLLCTYPISTEYVVNLLVVLDQEISYEIVDKTVSTEGCETCMIRRTRKDSSIYVTDFQKLCRSRWNSFTGIAVSST